ncbi:MAG: relaxase/mobilization nuclease domain-containing protein [Atopobiaceae bacterium]|nr:relaxase/mobilization nuclease domain-containing protein [Atopobiaceae bacterium]
MPFIKAISGHTRLGAAQRYLEKEGRALARDFLNLDAPMEGLGDDGLPEYGDYDWSSIMDGTREKLGNDRPFKGRKARTYKHYVISPDPRDAVSLSRLRSVTMSWVEENFGDYEVAVVYHDDNEHHVPHAHVVVNNTNLDTGRRLQDPDPGALNGSLQRIARDAGLTHFVGRLDGAARDETHYRRRAVDRTEASLARRGEYSWVADIRARVDVAKGIAKSPDDFRQALREMGVNVRESASRKGDWVYSLAGTPSRQVTGSKLGASYTRREVTDWLRSPTRKAPGPVTVRNVREVAARAIEVKDLRELVALSEAVSVVSRGGFRSLSAMDSAASRMRGMPNREAAVARLERARQYCAEHGILPERPTAQPSRRAAGSMGMRNNHGGGQEHRNGSRPARQQTRRDGRPER